MSSNFELLDHPQSVLFHGLSDGDKKEALKAAAIAYRAEERAEERALEKAIEVKRVARAQEKKKNNTVKPATQQQNGGVGRKRNNNNNNSTNIVAAESTGFLSSGGTVNSNGGVNKVKFVSKRQRLLLAEQQKELQEKDAKKELEESAKKNTTTTTTSSSSSSSRRGPPTRSNTNNNNRNNNNNTNTNHRGNNPSHRSNNNNTNAQPVGSANAWTDRDRQAVRDTYLGGKSKVNMTTEEYLVEKAIRKKKKSYKTTKSGKKIAFRFEWDDTDDTLRADDPLYNGPTSTGRPGGGERYTGGNGYTRQQRGGQRRDTESDHRYGRYNSNNNNNDRENNRHTMGERQRNQNKNNYNNPHNMDNIERRNRLKLQQQQQQQENDNMMYQNQNHYDHQTNIETKPLARMTARDWRIYRENHNIVCKGGKAPAPLRFFRDGNILHPSLLRALEQIMQYRDPTPIQRQAIPIGLQRRDLIGIAETGSGKTAAFGIPLVQYILQLPSSITAIENVAENGPLAIVLAPTRELALQIDGEFQKLLTFCVKPNQIVGTCIVGGQSMTAQAQRLRDGVHIIVGTPGRINECLELTYMVLNQCSYCVLDEGDRMIDMGFAPQLESILEAMGGDMKSEIEDEAYAQEKQDVEILTNKKQRTGNSSSTTTTETTDMDTEDAGENNKRGEIPKHRVTAMFSATMPIEVEQMAKKYLRFPAVISVGDKDSRKNARIQQNIIYVGNPLKKEAALRKLILDPRFMREKVLVFVNEKKHCEGVARQIERIGRRCVVLHGGKTQEEREKALNQFRQGGVILVATDVAGRGLDISNIAHVINYDLPARSIDSYSHRIGRTGRAGKEGVASSLLSDDDEGIMAPLKAYLLSTGSYVPDKLHNHPALNGGGRNGDDNGGGGGGGRYGDLKPGGGQHQQFENLID